MRSRQLAFVALLVIIDAVAAIREGLAAGGVVGLAQQQQHKTKKPRLATSQLRITGADIQAAGGLHKLLNNETIHRIAKRSKFRGQVADLAKKLHADGDLVSRPVSHLGWLKAFTCTFHSRVYAATLQTVHVAFSR